MSSTAAHVKCEIKFFNETEIILFRVQKNLIKTFSSSHFYVSHLIITIHLFVFVLPFLFIFGLSFIDMEISHYWIVVNATQSKAFPIQRL